MSNYKSPINPNTHHKILASFLKIFFAALLIFIYHCAPALNEDYLKFSEIPEEEIIKSIPEAIEKTEAQEILLGDTVAAKLTESDPVIELGRSDKYRTNYKLYKFHCKENEIYTVEIQSFCDSLSIAREIMFPLIIISDSEGNVLKHTNLAVYETLTSSISGLSFIYGAQQMYSPKEGEYYILIVSDNSEQKGNSITTVFRETTFRYTLRGILGKRYPWGSFRLSVKAK